jgi:hypothetical protein
LERKGFAELREIIGRSSQSSFVFGDNGWLMKSFGKIGPLHHCPKF